MNHHSHALVERPVACAGRGEYIAHVYYGVAGGALYHRVFKYSHKDPRQNEEATVLRNITCRLESRHRDFIVAISVIKRCLHPKSAEVANRDRKPHYERVFSWVVTHDNSLHKHADITQPQTLEQAIKWHETQKIKLPYTPHELEMLPVQQVVTTRYWQNAHVSVGLHGVERIVHARELFA